MTAAGAAAVRRLHTNHVAPLVHSLVRHEWEAATPCEGWRVQEVIAHFTSNMAVFVDPTQLPALPDGVLPSAEEMAELMIGDRRNWSPRLLVDEYDSNVSDFLDFLDASQAEPAASTMNFLGDFGNHPTHIFADMFAFDHYCHLAFDVLAPRGPIGRAAVHADAALLKPAIGWMLAGLPAMCRTGLGELDAPIRLDLTGPGGAQWLIEPPTGDDLVTVRPSDGSDAAAATVRSTTAEFIGWGTKRTHWSEVCDVNGDRAWAAPFLDAFNVI